MQNYSPVKVQVLENLNEFPKLSFHCVVCKKQFFRKYDLKAHQLVHVDKTLRTLYPCDQCHKKYLNQRMLDFHQKRVHLKQLKFSCSKCPGKSFVSLGELNKHNKVSHVVSDPLLIKCPHPNCSKVFKSESSLRYHEINHKSLTFICDQCGQIFNHPYLYNRHLRKHQQEPVSHKCNICDKTVTTLCSLKDHMRLHSGERPFICEHCGKAFRTKVILKSHLVVHTKEKKHICQFCGRRFTQRSPLKNHLINVHPDRMQEDDLT